MSDQKREVTKEKKAAGVEPFVSNEALLKFTKTGPNTNIVFDLERLLQSPSSTIDGKSVRIIVQEEKGQGKDKIFPNGQVENLDQVKKFWVKYFLKQVPKEYHSAAIDHFLLTNHQGGYLGFASAALWAEVHHRSNGGIQAPGGPGRQERVFTITTTPQGFRDKEVVGQMQLMDIDGLTGRADEDMTVSSSKGKFLYKADAEVEVDFISGQRKIVSNNSALHEGDSAVIKVLNKGKSNESKSEISTVPLEQSQGWMLHGKELVEAEKQLSEVKSQLPLLLAEKEYRELRDKGAQMMGSKGPEAQIVFRAIKEGEAELVKMGGSLQKVMNPKQKPSDFVARLNAAQDLESRLTVQVSQLREAIEKQRVAPTAQPEAKMQASPKAPIIEAKVVQSEPVVSAQAGQPEAKIQELQGAPEVKKQEVSAPPAVNVAQESKATVLPHSSSEPLPTSAPKPKVEKQRSRSLLGTLFAGLKAMVSGSPKESPKPEGKRSLAEATKEVFPVTESLQSNGSIGGLTKAMHGEILAVPIDPDKGVDDEPKAKEAKEAKEAQIGGKPQPQRQQDQDAQIDKDKEVDKSDEEAGRRSP